MSSIGCSWQVSKKNMQLKVHSLFPDQILNEIIKNEKDYLIEPFLDPTWINVWWKNIGNKEYTNIKYFVFSKNDMPIMVIPIVDRTIFFLKIVEIAGGKVSDYLSPIFNKKYNFTDLDLKFIRSEIIKHYEKCDIIFFRKQKKYLNNNNPLLCLAKPILGIHKSYNIQLNNFSENKKIKKILNDNRRQKKKLSNLGNVDFVIAKNVLEKEKILKSMIAQKEDRYKKTNVWNMFKSNNYKNFYYELIKSDFNFLKLHVSAIKVDKSYISTHFGFFNYETFYYLMPSFDNVNFGSYSGGNILLENLINFTKSNFIQVFDFTIGNEGYKKKWTNETNDLFDVLLTISILGKVTKILILLAFFCKKINIIDKLYKKIYKLFN